MLRRTLALVVMLAAALPAAATNVRVRNITAGPVTMPLPYTGIVPAGGSIIISDTLANVTANLGKTNVGPVFRLDVVPGGSANAGITAPVPGAVPWISNAQIDPDLVQYATTTLSNAQVKALTTAITIVPAPGVGKVLVPIAASLFLKYGGTNAFTASAGENIVLKHTGGANLFIGGAQAFLQATNSAFNRMAPANAAQTSVTDSKTLSDNVGFDVVNVGSAIAGNAGGDNLLQVSVLYYVVPAPAGW